MFQADPQLCKLASPLSAFGPGLASFEPLFAGFAQLFDLILARFDEVVVGAVFAPRAGRDFIDVDEFPIAALVGFQAQIIADGGRDVEAGAAVALGFGLGVAEDVLPVVRIERAAVFPLAVADFPLVVDGDPAAF